MSEQTLNDQSTTNPARRGAELVGLMFDALQLARIFSVSEGRLTCVRQMIRDAIQTGSQDDARYLEQEKLRYEKELTQQNQEFDQILSRLLGMKLSLEGNTTEEVEAKLAQRDRDIEEIKARVAAARA
jgi:hypothetical protein